MKPPYWSRSGVSRPGLTLLAIVSVVAVILVETLPIYRKQRGYQEKVDAAQLAQDAQAIIRLERRRLGIPIDLESDPNGTGMIGTLLSPVTSSTGYLEAKQMSTNPSFAAAMVDMLREARVGAEDLVAVGMSGSFPSLNIATYAALQSLNTRVVTISSAAASEWGANHVNLTWIEMERALYDQQIFRYRSIAASLGGVSDRGFGMSDEGLELLREVIRRNDLLFVPAPSLEASIEARMKIYDEMSQDERYKAYINIGGGAASVGTVVGKKQFKPGLNTAPPRGPDTADSVMFRFASRDIPVIHITKIRKIAEHYRLFDPQTGAALPIGASSVYVSPEYNHWLAGLFLAAIVFMLVLLQRNGRRDALFFATQHEGRKAKRATEGT